VKILHINHSANPAGGGPIEAIKQSARVLQECGHSIELLCLDSPNEPWLSGLALPTHAVGPSSPGYGYTPKLTQWLRENRHAYDAIIVNGLWQYGGFGTWRALRNTKQPYFVFPHGMLDPWFKKRYPLKHLKKWLYWRWAEYRVLRDAAAVLFTCEEERIQARQSFSPYRCNEVVVNFGTASPLGDADSQRSLFLERFPKLRGRRILLFLGRIHEKKGCLELIEAFQRALREQTELTGDLHLIMAGPADSEYARHVKSIAEQRELSGRITWTGMLSGDLKWGAFRAADAFVLPSYQENFGIAVAESLACGVPVLISNKVNIYREIAEGGAGLIEDAGLPGAVRLLQRWAALDSESKQSMRSAARRCFERRYEIRCAADSLIQVLESVGKTASSSHGHIVEAIS
jgi:glycosyltransferase involved in cell wall biosynthesis